MTDGDVIGIVVRRDRLDCSKSVTLHLEIEEMETHTPSPHTLVSYTPFFLHSDVLYKFQDLCPTSNPQSTDNEDDSTLELTQELDHTPEEVTGEWEVFT